LPVRRAVSFLHPRDQRPVFALPWEGVTLFGTTDVDHRPAGPGLETDAAIDAGEREYLMEALHYAFPGLELQCGDVQATLAGVRAVIDTGQADPSRESREYVLWDEQGLLTVAGGKLTTFRLMAHQALQAVRRRFAGRPHFDRRKRMLAVPPAATPWPEAVALEPAVRLRLLGRYGADEPALMAVAGAGEIAPIEQSAALWAELRWAARAEGVVHLDDLLMRRVRLGLLLPRGGLGCLAQVRAIVQQELAWDDGRWEREVDAYRQIWERAYAP
jgi:glycerol-3-phosphate dehydrogenase